MHDCILYTTGKIHKDTVFMNVDPDNFSIHIINDHPTLNIRQNEQELFDLSYNNFRVISNKYLVCLLLEHNPQNPKYGLKNRIIDIMIACIRYPHFFRNIKNHTTITPLKWLICYLLTNNNQLRLTNNLIHMAILSGCFNECMLIISNMSQKFLLMLKNTEDIKNIKDILDIAFQVYKQIDESDTCAEISDIYTKCSHIIDTRDNNLDNNIDMLIKVAHMRNIYDLGAKIKSAIYDINNYNKKLRNSPNLEKTIDILYKECLVIGIAMAYTSYCVGCVSFGKPVTELADYVIGYYYINRIFTKSNRYMTNPIINLKRVIDKHNEPTNLISDENVIKLYDVIRFIEKDYGYDHPLYIYI